MTIARPARLLPRGEGRRRRGVLTTAAIIVGVLAIWQVATMLSGTSVTVLPSPSDILMQSDWVVVLVAASRTVLSTLLGFLVGNVIGLMLAVLITASRTLSDIVYPFAVVVRSVPIVALAPFIILIAGRGAAAAIVVAALIVFFPTLVNVILGLRSVPPEAIELMRVVNASRAFQYARVRIPYALPSFVSALKISAPNAVLGVLTAEWIIGGDGLGRLIVQSWLGLNIPTMWGGVVLAAVVAWALFSVASLAEKLLLGWAVRT